MKLNILGINSTYHELSASLLMGGELVGAVEEERLTRVKHAKSALIDNPDVLPIESIMQCLKMGNISIEEVDIIAFSFNPKRRLLHSVNIKDTSEAGSWGTLEGETIFCNKLLGVPDKLKAIGFKGQFVWTDHSMAHAASAFFPSPFEEAAIISIDGIGEIESSLMAYGKKDSITSIKQDIYPNSVGFLWEKFAKFVGYSEYDACKIMSLASYGEKGLYTEQFESFIKINDDGFTIDPDVVRFRIEDYSKLEELFGVPKRDGQIDDVPQVYMNIASGLQDITTKILVNMANYLHRETGSKNLCMAGGVALNCVANKVLFEESPFENIYILPAAHDGGTSMGAAYKAHFDICNGDFYKPVELKHTYLGPEFSNDYIESLLKISDVEYSKSDQIEKDVAKLISEGKVIGWFQGRMEFGPRALGNRSLLADPRNPDMVIRMNRLVKHREDHRPFCPSVLEEDASDWFSIGKTALASHYMLMAYPVKEDKAGEIPAVIHVDGTCRIQRVQKDTNPRYHKLISEFKAITGVPVMLNTSFNDREPVVCTPDDAIKTFKRTKIDYLILGDYLLSKAENTEVKKEEAEVAHA